MLKLTTAGESHGPALVGIVTGWPAGLSLDRQAIDADLRRRQQGYGRSPRQQLEQDRVEVLAGLRHGRTLGTPLALLVHNRDHDNWAWGMSPWPPEGEPAGKGTKSVTLPRPGHAGRGGGDGHPGREGGRDRRGFRARGIARLGGARRDLPRRAGPLPGDEPRRWDRGRRVERRGDRRPGGDEAAADADAAAGVGGPA